jgi:hypothetical protein
MPEVRGLEVNLQPAPKPLPRAAEPGAEDSGLYNPVELAGPNWFARHCQHRML